MFSSPASHQRAGGGRLTLQERVPCDCVPQSLSQAPALPLYEEAWANGGCFAGRRPWSARPEMRAVVLGCPSPALHGTS